MLVYGDRSERVDPRARLTQIERKLRTISAMAPDAARHSALRDLLIDTGRLLQGVADDDFAVAGCDRGSPARTALANLLQAIAEQFCQSLDRDFVHAPLAATIPADLTLPDCVELKVPEGYAYYSLYPEAYIDAARSLGLSGPVRVIGIRSIGTSLAAVTAAAIGAPCPVTVRPFGSAYAREVAICNDLATELLDNAEAHFLIVDEGPGQSGSSFGAVADWLESRGVPRERIILMPSHDGDLGPHASEAHRSRWQGARKAVARFDARPFVSQWCEAELEDVSNGQWRDRVFDGETLWPAVNPTWERTKFLTRRHGRPVMLKFAGFGDEGLRKFDRAKLLHAAGLIAEPIELVHGFLAEHWLEDAVALPARAKPLRELAHYIGTRARLLPAQHPGASLEELLRMARRNIGLAFGEAAAERLDHWCDRLPHLQELVVPVETDNRLDRQEWLRMPDGRLLKSDAIDHCQTHDLVGCQDVIWDIAGAAIEFDLGEPELGVVVNDVEAFTARPISRELLAFIMIAYLAFRLGQASLSLEMIGSNAAERGRLEALAERYRRPLDLLLQQ